MCVCERESVCVSACMYMCVCVCVCVRERERGRETARGGGVEQEQYLLHAVLLCLCTHKIMPMTSLKWGCTRMQVDCRGLQQVCSVV